MTKLESASARALSTFREKFKSQSVPGADIITSRLPEPFAVYVCGNFGKYRSSQRQKEDNLDEMMGRDKGNNCLKREGYKAHFVQASWCVGQE